jgi:hypothetical protein
MPNDFYGSAAAEQSFLSSLSVAHGVGSVLLPRVMPQRHGL